MRASRRRFLSALIRASAIALGGEVARITAQDLSPDRRRAFRGRRPGEQRQVEGIPLCWCPPGRFTMGSPSQERGHRPDETQVEVTLTRGFWTAKYEATQVQWKRVMGPFPDRLPSAEFGEGDDFPVYWINFTEAEAFCARLTESGRRSGALPPEWAFTLPTEAQWEYACRAGTTTLSSFGDALSQEQANIGIETTDRTVRPRGGSRKVGSYPANPWGIHDMHGNVWEWCRDYYHPSCRAVPIPIATRRAVIKTATAASRASGGAAHGSSGPRSAERRRACRMSRTAAPITSGSAFLLSSANRLIERSEIRGMRSAGFHTAAVALGIALCTPSSARAQAWVPPDGEGVFTLTALQTRSWRRQGLAGSRRGAVHPRPVFVCIRGTHRRH